ncbi:MAG: Endodeoxyribonuclease RusA [Lentisphaerae bacterium ADurb.BinA184]|nr:MAG: Endodeoxyribonuclease RusA [Lentisphaerae bacterium ADurb.BinA184]
MTKHRTRIHFRIPPYRAPRHAWRRHIWEAAWEAARAAGAEYRASDRLKVSVVLYFEGAALGRHDVDNRTKDVLDALQGRVGGPKRERPCGPLIPNDSQVWQLCVAKRPPPRQSGGCGHVTVSGLRPRQLADRS